MLVVDKMVSATIQKQMKIIPYTLCRIIFLTLPWKHLIINSLCFLELWINGKSSIKQFTFLTSIKITVKGNIKIIIL